MVEIVEIAESADSSATNQSKISESRVDVANPDGAAKSKDHNIQQSANVSELEGATDSVDEAKPHTQEENIVSATENNVSDKVTSPSLDSVESSANDTINKTEAISDSPPIEVTPEASDLLDEMDAEISSDNKNNTMAPPQPVTHFDHKESASSDKLENPINVDVVGDTVEDQPMEVLHPSSTVEEVKDTIPDEILLENEAQDSIQSEITESNNKTNVLNKDEQGATTITLESSAESEPTHAESSSPELDANRIKELVEIKSMLDKISTDIHSIKDTTEPEHGEQEKFTNDFKEIRMRNDALRQELIAIKLDQNKRHPVDISKFTEQKIIESSKLNKLKDSTANLQNEVDLINKARRAQDNLKKRQDERKLAAQKRVKQALAEVRGPVEVEQIKENIRQLKEEMETIINTPISQIYPDDENEMETNEDDADVTGDSTEQGDADKEKKKPVSKNKQAHDDMLKKYLLMRVMKNNIQELTLKMNEIMAAAGVDQHTTDTTSAAHQNHPDEELADESASSRIKPESDEYYLHDDNDEGNASDLYEEEETEQPQPVEDKRDALAQSIAKSIAAVESVIYKKKEAPTEQQEPKPETTGKQIGNNNKSNRNKRGKKGKAPPPSVLEGIRNQQKQQKQKATASKPVVVPEKSEEEEVLFSNLPTTKIGTYNFLLKLQREMASMQIQMSKLQDGLRSANKTLQVILESEYSDMYNM